MDKESNLRVSGNAWVFGDARVYGDAEVSGNAEVFKTSHLLTIDGIGIRRDTTTFYRNKLNGITVRCGCFCDDIDKFVEAVEKTHGNNKHARVYKLAVKMAKEQIELEEEE